MIDRNDVLKLVKSLDTDELKLGELLFAVWDADSSTSPLYVKWGFKTFRDYAEQELGLHYKKAERCRKLWWVFGVQLAGCFDAAVLPKVGVSKLRVLMRFVDAHNVSEWLEKSLTMTFSELEHVIHKKMQQLANEEYGEVPSPDRACVHAAFYVTKDEKLMLDTVIGWARRRLDPRGGGNGRLLMKIIAEFVVPKVLADIDREKVIDEDLGGPAPL